MGKGGFPPIYLAPVNFDALYAQKLQEIQSAIAERMPDRGAWSELLNDDVTRAGLQALDQAVIALAEESGRLEGSARGMDGCIERARTLRAAFDRFDAPEAQGEVRWFERRGRGFGLNITPLNIAELFSDFPYRD